jgi:lysyl-tRNA synthetase class 2
MTDSAALPPDDENHIIAERREKLRQWREAGGAYPNDFHRTHYAGEITAQHTATPAETLDAQPEHVQLAGRVMLKRVMGKASFATIQDMSGRIQLYITNDGVGEDVHGAFKHWDLGDIVGCSGTLFRTRTGELTVKCDGIRLLSKALRPLPEKFHGLADQETRYRFRYLDLITNESSRNTFIARSRMMSALRAEMTRQGFLEVETPMMHPDPGRCRGQAFQDAPQRARHGTVPAHRARAVPEAPGGRRIREGVRGQPQLPQ